MVMNPIDKKKIKTFKTSTTDIFNDEYKKLEKNVEFLRNKYLANYVHGTLKSNIHNMTTVLILYKI